MPTNLPTASVVAASTPMTQQSSGGNKNGIPSPLLGVTASEGEQAATPGAQLNGTTAAGTSPNTSTLANTKEKTPMCLVNELARFNKVCG